MGICSARLNLSNTAPSSNAMGVRGWVEGGLASEVVVSWVVGIGHVSSAGMLNALKVYFYNKFQFRRINLK